MEEVVFKNLGEYLSKKLDELLAYLQLGEDATARSLRASEEFDDYPNGIFDAVREGRPMPMPSRMRPLAWGEFNPAPSLARDCALAALDADAYNWVPYAVDVKFSSLMSNNLDTSLRCLFADALKYIAEYVAGAKRSWIGLEVSDFDIEDEALRTNWYDSTEGAWGINDRFGVVVNPDRYSTGLIFRRHFRNDTEDDAIADLRRFLSLFRIYARAALETPRWWGYTEHWEEYLESTGDATASELRSGTWLPSVTLTVDEVTEVARIWTTWSKRDRVLDAAVERFEDAVFSMHPADTAAHAIICMEAVVASRARSQDQKRDILTRRAPNLLAARRHHPFRTRELLGKLYGTVRKGKAHTDSLEERSKALARIAQEKGDEPEDLALELLGWASDAILEMHSRLVSGSTLPEIWSQLDKSPNGR